MNISNIFTIEKDNKVIVFTNEGDYYEYEFDLYKKDVKEIEKCNILKINDSQEDSR